MQQQKSGRQVDPLSFLLFQFKFHFKMQKQCKVKSKHTTTLKNRLALMNAQRIRITDKQKKQQL